MVFTPRHESLTGSSLSGSDGAQNRAYTLFNANSILAQMQIIISNTILQEATDFTFNSTTGTITFLNQVWNNQNISIDYFTNDEASSSSSGSVYATPLQVAEFSGFAQRVELEQLGTGDNSNASFDTDYGNIIASSYTIAYGASGSNSITTMTESTHYSISKDDGRILLTAAGITALSTNVLYASYTHVPQFSNTTINRFLVMATKQVDKLTANYWGTPVSTTEYFDGYDDGYPHTDAPFGYNRQRSPEFQLKFRSVSATPVVYFLDNTSSPIMSVDDVYTRWFEDGRIVLTANDVPNGQGNVKIVYSHGYDEVPEQVQELCALITGLMCMINVSGGSFKDVSTYQLGRKSFSVGETYINVRTAIDTLKSRIDMLLEDLGPRYGCA